MKKLMIVACAAAICGGAWAADEAKPVPTETANAKPAVEEEEKDEPSFPISVEAGLAFDSKFLSYGLVDNNDPILTPSASITFFDWLTFGVEALFDTTKYGKKAGYGNRAGRYFELDPSVELRHTFSEEDAGWLPTAVELAVGYSYEYHPRSMGGGTGEPGDDTQFVTFEIGLPDLWIEPTFSYERDIDRDNGTYLNLELGHEFPLIDGDGEDADPVLALRPSVAQGFGNSQRVKGYLDPLDHSGLMDTCLKLELTWNICDHVALAGYVAYYDFLFDRQIRDASRGYEAHGRWDESWNFIGGLSLTLSF
jgi:hypothetical protein